jgi:hypothetical protein
MDAREVTRWQVFEQMFGPLGPERFDYLFAQLQATIANANRGRKGKAFKPADFAPRWVDRKRWPWAEPDEGGQQTGEQMLEAVKQYQRSMGGRTR